MHSVEMGKLWLVSDILHPIDLYPHTRQIWVEASQDDKHQRWSDKIPSLIYSHALSYTQSLLTYIYIDQITACIETRTMTN